MDGRYRRDLLSQQAYGYQDKGKGPQPDVGGGYQAETQSREFNATGLQHEREASGTGVKNESDSWVVQIERKFEDKENKKRQPSTDVCIYKVPNVFMDGNREAYVPKYVSFGPFHHDKLSAMEYHKLEAVHRTLERLKGMTIKDLITEVQNSDKKIRDCYEDCAFEYDAKTLAWMMTMDACFILEFLRAFKKGGGQKSLVFKRSVEENVVWHGILMDILKLENQIPLFLVINILQLEFLTRKEAVEFLFEMLCEIREFRGYPFLKGLPLERTHITGGTLHLLDLCRKVTTDFLIKSNPQQSDSDSGTMDEVCNIPKAELLHKAGVQFKPSADGKVELENRSFAGSTLSLPPILVEDKTDIILLNVIAFEECNRSNEQYVFSHYISLMDKLINSEKDVGQLTKEGIIINYVGSEEVVAKMFNSFSITTGVKDLLTKVAKDIKDEYDRRTSNPIHKAIDGLNQFIEEHPLYFVSIVWALLIFGLTVVQAVYSVKGS